MKIISLITFLFLGCCSAFSQEVRIEKKKVNPVLIKTLLEKYPKAKRLKYYVYKNSQLIEADFTSQKQNISLTFNGNNEIIELEKEIEYESLSPTVQLQITKYLILEFKNFQLKECQEITSNSVSSIEIEIQHDGALIDCFFDVNGNFISLEKIEEKPINTQF